MKSKNNKKSNAARGAISRRLLVATGIVSVILVAGAVKYLAQPQKQIDQPSVQQPQKTMLELINDVRAKAGKQSVVIDPAISKAAQLKVDDQVARNYWSHNINKENTFQFLNQQLGKQYPAGENLAKCQANDQQSVEDWVKSPGHYAVMTGDYTKMGYAEKRNPIDDNCLYTVMYFVRY